MIPWSKSWNVLPKIARSHWLLGGHMTPRHRNRLFPAKSVWVGTIAKCMKPVTACWCLFTRFFLCVIFHQGKQVDYVSLQSQCLPRFIRVNQNNRCFFHVIKSIKGFIYDSRDIHCLKRTSCSTGVKLRKSSPSTHVQYCRPDSSGQNLESVGV